MIYYFQGPPALRSVRMRQLQHRLAQQHFSLSHLTVHADFLVEATDERVDLNALGHLLRDSQCVSLSDCAEEGVFWVVPRLGTISSWSSKATDIVQICGFSAVARIEHMRRYTFEGRLGDVHDLAALFLQVHDPLTESVITRAENLSDLFLSPPPAVGGEIDILSEGKSALYSANVAMGLALTEREIEAIFDAFQALSRNPTETELMMFAQVNSEHCRHKIFNAPWRIDGQDKPHSLFSMIRNTYRENPQNVLIAYKDNAAVIEGSDSARFYVQPKTKQYAYHQEATPIVLKVETHNHPTAISPFPGAATGSGGEIRDEAATGRGAKPKAGLTGFSVSHLHIPDLPQPWEIPVGKPSHMASALDIMLAGPIGAAAFNNEYGRPNLCGYFRTLELNMPDDLPGQYRGYHKPIMLAGGIGTIQKTHLEKKSLPVGAKIIVLGGPAMPIGLGGGSASSRASQSGSEALDFASVQRANAEMERRCQEVIDTCWTLGDSNPILSIHDVGAGGLSNAIPELVHACQRGAHIALRDIPNAAAGMSPLEIWCNEAQERFVLAILPESVALFHAIATRERCLWAVVGEVTQSDTLIVEDSQFDHQPVRLPMDVLFHPIPLPPRTDHHAQKKRVPFAWEGIALQDAVQRVLQFPCVADKTFLITIGDRSVTGLVVQDQMVGPWQVPVADVAVTASGFCDTTGEALAMGERAPIALLDAAASARMAVGETITNLAAASIENIERIALSANWMAAPDVPGEGAALYDAVEAIGMDFCPALGISIPVGKDSLSMKTQWEAEGASRTVTSPLSLVITGTAAVDDVRRTLTPQCVPDEQETEIVLIDLGAGANRLGGSVFAQVYQQMGDVPADVTSPATLKAFFETIQTINRAGLLLAYHDRSDGGLLATLCEMQFASHVGFTVDLTALADAPIPALFSEELGAVIQIRRADREAIFAQFAQAGLKACVHPLGHCNAEDAFIVLHRGEVIYREMRTNLHRLWSKTSFSMQALRDDPTCAQSAYDVLCDANDPGLPTRLTFSPETRVSAPFIATQRPKVMILREQGVNGHIEMAAAFDQAGFDVIDVHMSDILSGCVTLDAFQGMAACGGFSYGDVLGAGRGWAQSILQHPETRQQFADFFARDNTFALGVCNGCQMLSQLKSMIPGAAHWPTFEENQSLQFESRLVSVEIPNSPSILFQGMTGSILPVVVAHGEGRVAFASANEARAVCDEQLVALQYVDHYGKVTTRYPFNPNGSEAGLAGLTTTDGRVTILMPHPERMVRVGVQASSPRTWGTPGPWQRFFDNARAWLA